MNLRFLTLACSAVLCACAPGAPASRSAGPAAAPRPAAAVAQPVQATVADTGQTGTPFVVEPLNTFDMPWAMTFLPDGRALVTQKKGQLKLLTPGGEPVDVAGVPEVAYGGQGGLGDVVPHPRFASNRQVYLSHVEAGANGTRGAVVARYTLDLAGGGPRLTDRRVIWTQTPKVTGEGHFGHRIAFDREGMLWITSGDRQKFDPAQDLGGNLGKVIRLFDDGRVPRDNPLAARGAVASQVWSYGHRNLLGIAFDAQGRPWVAEMGPKGGDELNRIERGSNYGWPIVSDGDNYRGEAIPRHATRPEFNAPEISWTPVISPGGFIVYTGTRFPQWRGHGLIAGLSSKALVRVELGRDSAREAARYPMGKRIREVEQGPGGEIYLLEDGPGGRLLRLVPKT